MSLGAVLFNTIDANGVEWVLDDTSMDGWGTAGSTIALTPRARASGVTASEPFDKERVLILSGLISAPTPGLLNSSLDFLYSEASLDQTVLGVNEQGLVRHMLVQRQDKVIPKRLSPYQAMFSLQVVAKDPRKYGNLITASTSLPSSSGGRTYPATYPITYTGVTASGVITLNNAGNESAPVWFRVDGAIPSGGWSITHLGQNRTLVFATSLALASGEFITCDMDAREILAQGQSPRSGWVTSRGWFDLDPGRNDIAFSSAVYSSSALLTALTMPAWS
ncbi:hypothetical protein [Arthrobacter sp. NA-172]|uniref:hypothetical protein n=1 Tax=Arthrobacter sp. NA-172 TaxID=3367524 RepID=UPI0037548929